MNENNLEDKRQFPRIDVEQTIRFRVESSKEMRTGRIENISGGGVLLYTRELLKPGEKISVEFKLPGNIGHVMGTATVAWARSASDSPYESSHWAGIQFDKIPERSREDIVEFVARKLRAFLAKQGPAYDAGGGRLPSVLIVDDDPDILEMMKTLLDNEFNVITTRNGSAALEIAESEKPDLIFLDLQMPILDGMNTLIMLKSNESTKPIPVMMLSVSSKKSDVVTAFRSGAAGFITKPFEPEVVVRKAKQTIGIEKLPGSAD